MPLTVLLHAQSKPGRSGDAVAFYRDILGDTRARPGCTGVRVICSLDDENMITLIESWESRDQQEAYMAWRASGDTTAAGADLFAAAPTFEYFDEMDA